MAEQQSQLHRELLDLGLEDRIPLPEAVAAPEVQAAVGQHDSVGAIRLALGDLLRAGQVRLLRGHWRVEPHMVTTEEGLALLEDPAWYGFRTEDPWEERLYFVNVENLRDREQPE
jgi:hypothetical protein